MYTASIYSQQVSSALYTATFNNIGIEVTFSSGTPNGSSVSIAFCNTNSPAVWHDCHPLSRIAANKFTGSVFGLDAGTKYLIRIRNSVSSGERIDTVTTRRDIFSVPNGVIFHVAKNGNDANEGTSAGQAHASLEHALSLAQPGATILLHEGHYYESVTLPRSGTQSSPILIRNNRGEKVVIDGRDTAFKPTWAIYDAASNVYRTGCTKEPQFAYYNGGHLFANPSLKDLVSNTWNMESGFYCDGTYMYIHLPHAGAPASTDTVMIPAFTSGITCSGKQYIQIRGLEICYFGLDEYSRGIYFDGSSFNLVDSCYLHHSGIGVAFKRASNFNTIQHCSFSESPIDNWTWSAVKEGTGYYEAGGVVVYGSSSNNAGNVIRNNHFFHMFDGSHLYSEDDGGPTVNMDFHDNLIENVNDDCIETDGVGSNCRIYNNTFRDFLSGVSVAPAATGPTYIVRNLFTGWETHDEYVGYPVKFNVESDLTTDWVYMYHNTCFTAVPDQPGFLFKEYSNWNNIVSRNNIFAGTGYAFESWPEKNPVDFDYDLFYSSAAGKLVDWADVKYSTIAAFSASSGMETHGISADPKFNSNSNKNFSLLQKSPAIDKGVLIPNINDGFSGSAPDIGCYEYGNVSSTKKSLQKIEKDQISFIAYEEKKTGSIVFMLRGTQISSPVSVKIFNCQGQLAYSGELNAYGNRISLPLQKIMSGVYCVKVSTTVGVFRNYFTVLK
jgi:hypothetical protein